MAADRTSYRAHQRQKFYDAARFDCDGKPSQFAYCNLCDQPVRPGQPWDISHEGAPRALGGETVGVAHRRCNQDHNNREVTPMVAKARRQYRAHIGAAGPGRGARPMACGKRSKLKKTMRGEVVSRADAAVVFADFIHRHYFGSRGQ